MSEKLIDSLLNPTLVSKWIIARQFIWQMRFLSVQDLGRLASDRGLGFSTLSDDIQHLWQIGLLRADLVVSKRPLDIRGLGFIEQNEGGEYLYADVRDCADNSDGLGGIIKELGDLSNDIYLMFHPLRYFVLYQIEQQIVPRVQSIQILRSTEGYQNVIKWFIESFNKWSADERFRARVRRWNEITSLAVAAEPFTFSKVFGVYSIPYPYFDNEEEFYLTLRKQFDDCKEILEKIGLDEVKTILHELCREAEGLEPNDDIRRVVRLTKKKYRIEKVKGKLGGSVYLLTMAEIIRRASERVFNTELPEEDELGFGWETGDFKEFFYGAQRLIDNHEAKSEFLRDLRLDYNVRLRWYVEGDTELSALESELSTDENIEIINLRGEVIAKRGKGLSFKENLLNDIRRSIYSFVSLDGDVEDNKRVLLRAVEAREMFGMFFISEPDFEFENFTADELAGILWEVALEQGAQVEEKENFLKLTTSATNGKELFSSAKQALTTLQKIDKGKNWGERLMKFAKENPARLLSDGSTKTRPIIEAVMLARHTAECNYRLSREECRLDKQTGKIFNCTKYFAYGSNMLKQGLGERVPSAMILATGVIHGYKIWFNKRSTKDGSGKCNLVKTEDPADAVFGVVYEIFDIERPLLDKHEGLGSGYNVENVLVQTGEKVVRAYTYIADANAIDDSLRPYSWYKNLVIEGARQNSLPPEYIELLESFEATDDPDDERAKKNQRLVRR